MIGASADKWDIKPNLAKDNALTFKISIDALVNGSEEHHAVFNSKSTVQDKIEDNFKTKLEWTDFEIDGGDSREAPAMTYKVNSRGVVVGVVDMEDPFRRMLTPLYFAYPESAVGEGDKWEVKTGPDGNYKLAFEVKGTETIAGDETLKIVETIKESDGTYGDGTWWVNKAGVPVKFELKLKQWVVPFAGPELVDATIKGTRKV